MLLRVANADVLPYDYVEFARTMRKYLPAIDHAVAEHHWTASTAALTAALDKFEREAAAFKTSRDSALAASPPAATLKRTNQALMQVERALTRPQGLKTRPWFRNLIYVADEDNGYANMVLPSVNEAIRAGNAELTRSEIDDLATRFGAATTAIADARAAIGGN
jgi:N-acetylated-alpha-linked acidic dipeptidase